MRAPGNRDARSYAEPYWYRGMSSPYYKQTHRDWRAKVRAFMGASASHMSGTPPRTGSAARQTLQLPCHWHQHSGTGTRAWAPSCAAGCHSCRRAPHLSPTGPRGQACRLACTRPHASSDEHVIPHVSTWEDEGEVRVAPLLSLGPPI